MPPLRTGQYPVIEPIKEPATGGEHPKPPYDILPKHEFSMLLIAPRGSGKTTLLLNFLLKFYKDYFHRVHVFSPTMAGDSKWETARSTRGVLAKNNNKHVLEKGGKNKNSKDDSSDEEEDEEPQEQVNKPMDPVSFENSFRSFFATTRPRGFQVGDTSTSPAGSFNRQTGAPGTSKAGKDGKKFTGKLKKEHMHVDYDGDDLNTIMAETMSEIKKYKHAGKTKHSADRQLLIFDDLVGSTLFTQKRHDPFRRLFTTMRHYSTSVILVSQGYMEVPKTVRINTSMLIVFDIANQKELHSIYEENTCGMTEDQWMKAYHYATNEPYSFLCLNYMQPKGHRVWKRFEEEIPVDQDATVDTGAELRLREASDAGTGKPIKGDDSLASSSSQPNGKATNQH